MIVQFVRRLFKSDVKEMKGPEGLLWLEAEDVLGQNRRLQIGVLNTRLRNPELVFSPFLYVIYTMPAASAGGSFGAERLEALRSAVRGVEWN